MTIRANLLYSNPSLRALVCAAPVVRVFDGLEPAQRERLERLQTQFLELRQLFASAKSPSDFRACYPGRIVPPGATFADGLLRLVRVLRRIDATLSRHSTGWIHRGDVRRYAVDNPELTA